MQDFYAIDQVMRGLRAAVEPHVSVEWRTANDRDWGQEWGLTLGGILRTADREDVELPAELLPTVEEWLNDRSLIMIPPRMPLADLHRIVADQKARAVAHAL